MEVFSVKDQLVMEKHFSIEVMTLKWISSYLEKMQFVAQISESIRIVKEINHSVPQGSIIHPVPFSCYVSILQDKIAKYPNSVLFGNADDHNLTYSFRPENTQAKLFLENNNEEIRNCIT